MEEGGHLEGSIGESGQGSPAEEGAADYRELGQVQPSLSYWARWGICAGGRSTQCLEFGGHLLIWQ